MTIQLIHGEFNSIEALKLITEMIHVKIKYHENKIIALSNEEDVKTRESKIKQLQKELFELREATNSKNDNLKIDAIINIG
jgi:hypothetical protein